MLWALDSRCASLHNWCWLCPEAFKQLLVFSPQRPPALDEWAGQASLTLMRLRNSSLSELSVLDVCRTMAVRSFRYQFLVIKVLATVWCTVTPSKPCTTLLVEKWSGVTQVWLTSHLTLCCTFIVNEERGLKAFMSWPTYNIDFIIGQYVCHVYYCLEEEGE